MSGNKGTDTANHNQNTTPAEHALMRTKGERIGELGSEVEPKHKQSTPEAIQPDEDGRGCEAQETYPQRNWYVCISETCPPGSSNRMGRRHRIAPQDRDGPHPPQSRR